MVHLLVARHGQSEWNAAGRWQGQADPPLSELGLAQARAAAAAIGAVDAIVASDLERALTTASIIAETIGVGPVIVDPDLRERDAGEWQGLTRAEIEAAYPGHLEQGRFPPGWESDESLQVRAVAALDRVVSEVGSGQVLVVAHGGLIYALEGLHGVPWSRIANLHGRWFRHVEGALELGDRVSLVADESTTIPDVI